MAGKRYTATDAQTGRTVTFEWHQDTPPTEADMAEVFQAAGPTKDGVGQGDVMNFTPPAAPDPDAVQPNSPQDLLERGSRAVFGEAAPMVNWAATTAMQASPLGLVPTVLEGGSSAGGMIGGTLGALGSRSYAGGVAGAAGGGAIGGGLKRWFRGQPQEASDVAWDAAGQGALQAVAPGIGKALEKVALPIYKAALRPGALAREFDVDIAARGLKERLPVDVPASVAKAAARTTASRQQALTMGREAEDPNNLIQSREVFEGLGPVFQKARTQEALGEGPGALQGLQSRVQRIAKEAGGTPGRRAIPEGPPKIMRVPSRQQPLAMSGDQALALQEFQLGHQADLAPGRVFQPTEAEVRAARQLGPSTAGVIPPRILNGPAAGPRPPVEFVTPGTPAVPAVKATPGGFTNVRAQALKEEAQDLGANALKARALGHPVNEVDALGKMEVAAGFQRALEKRVPGLKEQNLNTKELLALLKALEVSEGRQLGGTGSGNIVADVMAGATGLAATGGNPMGATAGLAAARLLRGVGSNQSMSKAAILLDRTGKGLGGDRLTNAVRLLRMKIADVDEQTARERERE